MGFGIALIGYAFLLMGDLGGALFAAPVLAYGFFLASRLEGNFLRASVSSLFMLPRGIFMVIYSFADMKEGAYIGLINTFNTITFILFQLAWLMMSFFWLSAVINIATECNSAMINTRARITKAITITYIAASTVATVLNSGGMLGAYAGAISVIMFIMMYVVIIINLIMLHTCFVLITSERQYEKDKQRLAKERSEALKKAREKHIGKNDK